MIDLEFKLNICSSPSPLDEHTLLFLLGIFEDVEILLLRLPVRQSQTVLDPLQSQDVGEGGGAGDGVMPESSSSNELISERGRLLDEDVGGFGELVGKEIRGIQGLSLFEGRGRGGEGELEGNEGRGGEGGSEPEGGRCGKKDVLTMSSDDNLTALSHEGSKRSLVDSSSWMLEAEGLLEEAMDDGEREGGGAEG